MNTRFTFAVGLLLTACAAQESARNAPATPTQKTAGASNADPNNAAVLASAVSDPKPDPAVSAPSAAAAEKGNISGTVTTVPANAVRGGAVVFLEDGPKDASSGMTATIDNHQMAFSPYITVLAVGGTVKFDNTDPFPHNVFSPKPEGWDIGLIPQRGARQHSFDKPGFFTLLCNLHPNMIGYLVVTPSGYFAKTDSSGKFVIKDVPAGTYKVTAWAPRLKTTTQSVTVNGDVTSNFEVKR